MNPLRVDGVKSLGPDKTPRDSVDRAAGKLSSCSLLVPRLFAPRAGEVAIWAGPLRMVSAHRCHCFGVCFCSVFGAYSSVWNRPQARRCGLQGPR